MRLNEEGLWLDPGSIVAKNFMLKEKNVP